MLSFIYLTKEEKMKILVTFADPRKIRPSPASLLYEIEAEDPLLVEEIHLRIAKVVEKFSWEFDLLVQQQELQERDE